MKSLRLALIQLNPRVGATSDNRQNIEVYYQKALQQQADIVIFPELALVGYPPEDLLLQTAFIAQVQAELKALASNIGNVPMVVGAPLFVDDKLYNGAAIIEAGQVVGWAKKIHLPNYGVFDEKRYFLPASKPTLIQIGQHRLAITICEDLWVDGQHLTTIKQAGSTAVVNLSASPYHRGKIEIRQTLFAKRAKTFAAPVAFVNVVGGQDDLIFDGNSAWFAPDGQLIQQAKAFAEDIFFVDVVAPGHNSEPLAPNDAVDIIELKQPSVLPLQVLPTLQSLPPMPLCREAEMVSALCLSLQDYVRKNGFKTVLLGLSGGIDSALVAMLAVRALGAEHVYAMSLPTRFNSAGTKQDAVMLAQALQIHFTELAIEHFQQETKQLIEPHITNAANTGLAFENTQARLRGLILMALSNAYGHLLLATGNKSELAMGYATLYGDMAGGFAPIKDLTKTWVYRIAKWLRDVEKMPLPETILNRAPSAELREQQTDQDTLPPYDVLDQIIEYYVEQDKSAVEISKRGFDLKLVTQVIQAINRAEYKRRQAPLGTRISQKAFGRDRRMPITQGYQG